MSGNNGRATVVDEIEIENIGPIVRLSLPALPGKVVVLDGPNGVGKSTALNAVDKLTTGRGRLESRDGTVNGKVSGFGSCIRVVRGGANRKTGECLIANVETDFHTAELIDPGFKDPVAADARRIKTLVALSGEMALPERFIHLAHDAEHFREIVSPASLKTGDLVDMAAAIKRDFEAASRARAQVAESQRATASAHRQANEGVDLSAPHDSAELQAALEAAVTAHTELVQMRESGLRLREQAMEAETQLHDTQKSYSGPSVAETEQAVADATAARNLAIEEVEKLQRQLAEAETVLRERCTAAGNAERQRDAARQHNHLTEGWRQSIALGRQATVPDDAEVQAAKETVDQARAAIEEGARVRDALQREQQARRLQEQANESDLDAQFLRESAVGTNDVLTDAVAKMGGPFKIVASGNDGADTRLAVYTEARGDTFFADLSDGEKCKTAIDVVLNRFRAAVFSLPQDLWERLDEANRVDVADHIRGTDLMLLTAAASRDPNAAGLRWSVYEPEAVNQ